MLVRGDCQICGQLHVYVICHMKHSICYACYDELIEEFEPEEIATGDN